jgi:hypothetical protein
MLVPCLAPRTVLALLNPGGTFRVRDGILLDPAPDPLAQAESLEDLAASGAEAVVLREFCRLGCRSLQVDLKGVGGAVPCVLSVVAGDEEALVGVRVLQLDAQRSSASSATTSAADDDWPGPDEATIGTEHLDDFQALEASLLGEPKRPKRPLSALEVSLLGDAKRSLTAMSDSESEVSWVEVGALEALERECEELRRKLEAAERSNAKEADAWTPPLYGFEALERECQELRLKLEAAERSNAKLTAEVRAVTAEQEKAEQTLTALKRINSEAQRPLVLKVGPKQASRPSSSPSRSPENVAAAVQTDSTPPPPLLPTRTGIAGGKTGVTGFDAGSHPRWLAGILNAAFEAQMSKNFPPPPADAEADRPPSPAGAIGKLLMPGGLAYHPKMGWHQSPPPRKPTSKIGPEEDAASFTERLLGRTSSATDALEWTKNVQPRRKLLTKRTGVVCPDPPTTLPAPI